MSNEVKRQYLDKIRERYEKATKRQKTLILDEFCKVCELTRKHAIKLLNEQPTTIPPRPGPKSTYGKEIETHIVKLWRAMNRMCSKKIVAAIPLWLEYYYGITPDGKSSTWHEFSNL